MNKHPLATAVCAAPSYMLPSAQAAGMCGKMEGARLATWVTLAVVVIFFISLLANALQTKNKAPGSGWWGLLIALIIIGVAWLVLPKWKQGAKAKEWEAQNYRR